MVYTTINCNLKCIHQNDGMCTLNSLNTSSKLSSNSNCVHFEEPKKT